MMERFLRWVARLVLGRVDVAVLSSETEELYRHRVERDGKEQADRWLRRERRRALVHLLRSGLKGVRDGGGQASALGPRAAAADGAPSVWETGFEVARGFRSSLRSLTRAPGAALTIVGTLALGIGGTTAAFSVVHSVLVQPLPFPEPHELVRISNHSRGHDWVFAVADYLALEEQQTQFEAVAAMEWHGASLASAEGAERILVHSATPSLFRLLGLRPVAGRVFTEDEAEPGAASTALVGWGFWNQRLGGDPAAIGRTIRLDGQEVTVVGVLPSQPGPLLEDAEVVVALQLEPPTRKGPFFLVVLGRLADGAAPAAAAAELRAINERIFPLWQDSWSDHETTWAMKDLKEYVVGDVGTSLWVVMGAALFVLLMVCVNAASLLLARLMDRRRELAIRTALGASRGQLVGHLLTESLLLVALGMGGGLLLALAGMRLVTSVGADFIPRTGEVGITGPVLLFFAATAGASLVLFGLLPALQSTGSEVPQAVREGGARSGQTSGMRRIRGLLVATQVTVAVPLLVGGGLLLTSFGKLTRVDPGFDAERVLTLNVALPTDRYDSSEELSAFWRSLLDQIRAVPGIEEAGVGQGRPPREAPFTNNFVLEDQPLAPGESQPTVPWVFGSPEYFEALGSRLVAGRMFDPILDDSLFVVLVDEAWALRFYDSPGDAVGRRFQSGGCTGDDCPWGTVIGVMEDVRYNGLREASPGTMFLNADVVPNRSSVLVVRAALGGDPAGYIPQIRDLVRRADVEAAISRIATGDDLIRSTLRVPRYLAILVAAFAALSLLLAILGIYGVMETFVRRHRRDIGIRLALGGKPGNVVGLVLRRGMSLVAAGAVTGLLGAVAVTRLLRALLFGVEPTDPLVMGASVSLLVLVAALTCWRPAVRAARIPPREVMAEE